MAFRKLKARPIVPAPDKYFLTTSEVSAALGLSNHTFRQRLRYWRLYGIPEPVVLGDTPSDIRFRIDDLHALYPAMNPSGTTWLERYKAETTTAINPTVSTPSIQESKSI